MILRSRIAKECFFMQSLIIQLHHLPEDDITKAIVACFSLGYSSWVIATISIFLWLQLVTTETPSGINWEIWLNSCSYCIPGMYFITWHI